MGGCGLTKKGGIATFSLHLLCFTTQGNAENEGGSLLSSPSVLYNHDEEEQRGGGGLASTTICCSVKGGLHI
jgi:hypothetical protein